MKSATAARLRVALVVLAWLAQALMPVAHAALMGNASGGAHGVWCGDPADAQRVLAALPAELRAPLDEGDASAERLASCTLLCAVGSPPPSVADIAPTVSLRAAGLEPPPADACCPPGRPQSRTPPAHAPPAQA